MAAAHALEKGFALARAKSQPPITPFVVKILTRDVIYDASKAAAELGWAPRTSSLEGVERFARVLGSGVPEYERAARPTSQTPPVE
jgi:nucleoside-diphosphate-sugar epimerase